MLKHEMNGNLSYKGTTDYKRHEWFNVTFIKRCYSQFNSRFFNNLLPSDIDFYIVNLADYGKPTALASTGLEFVDVTLFNNASDTTSNLKLTQKYRVDVTSICFNNLKWKSRFYLENALLHEMCHVHQIYVVLEQDKRKYENDLLTDPLKTGHGVAFIKSAYRINLDPNNNEGYFVSPYKFGDELCKEQRVSSYARLWQANLILNEIFQCIETHKPLLPRQKRFLAKYDHRVDEHWNLVKIKKRRDYRD